MKTIFKYFMTKKKKGENILVCLPDSDVIHCEIETPQFNGSKDDFTMYRQKGIFYKNEMKFYPYYSLFGTYCGDDHAVTFHDYESLKKAIVKLL